MRIQPIFTHSKRQPKVWEFNNVLWPSFQPIKNHNQILHVRFLVLILSHYCCMFNHLKTKSLKREQCQIFRLFTRQRYHRAPSSTTNDLDCNWDHSSTSCNWSMPFEILHRFTQSQLWRSPQTCYFCMLSWTCTLSMIKNIFVAVTSMCP